MEASTVGCGLLVPVFQERGGTPVPTTRTNYADTRYQLPRIDIDKQKIPRTQGAGDEERGEITSRPRRPLPLPQPQPQRRWRSQPLPRGPPPWSPQP